MRVSPSDTLLKKGETNMSNELFTTRNGRQVPIPVVTLPATEVVSLMRLKEDHEVRGSHLSLLGVLLDVLDKGKRQVKTQWRNGDLNKDRREFAKAAVPYMRDTVKYAKELQELAIKYGIIAGSPVNLPNNGNGIEPNEFNQEEELSTQEETLTQRSA